MQGRMDVQARPAGRYFGLFRGGEEILPPKALHRGAGAIRDGGRAERPAGAHKGNSGHAQEKAPPPQKKGEKSGGGSVVVPRAERSTHTRGLNSRWNPTAISSSHC